VLAKNPDGTVKNAIAAGQFLGSLIDFIIIAVVVFLITKALIKPPPPGRRRRTARSAPRRSRPWPSAASTALRPPEPGLKRARTRR
jgi:large-conductance mechanosensitive channel